MTILPAVGVVFGVRREHHAKIQIQTHRISANLNVAFFQHVEQADLDLRRQIGQLVDAEDSPVCPGNQSEMHRQLAREISPLRMLDHIDFADQVGDRNIRRGQLFVIAVVAPDPLDRRRVTLRNDHVAGMLGNRRERVVVYFRAGHHRNRIIQQSHQLAQHASLGLAPQPEKQDVVLGKDRILDLGYNRLVVTQDSGKKRLARRQPGDQIVPHLVLD